MYNLQFIKSIIEVHNYYQSNNYKNQIFYSYDSTTQLANSLINL